LHIALPLADYNISDEGGIGNFLKSYI